MDLHVTFLLSIYMCLTKSLAKHSEIDFQREFSSDTLRCFEQQLVFGGEIRGGGDAIQRGRELLCVLVVSVGGHSFRGLGHQALGDGTTWWEG